MIVFCLCNTFVQKNYWKHFPAVQQTEKEGSFKLRLNNFVNMYKISRCLIYRSNN